MILEAYLPFTHDEMLALIEIQVASALK